MATAWTPLRQQQTEEAFNATDWTAVQTYYDEGNSYRATFAHFGLPSCRLDKAIKRGLFKCRDVQSARLVAAKRPRKPMSAEGRANISAAKRKWNQENPELLRQHMIRRARNKNRSVPCERAKEWLRQQEIDFAEEYMPLKDKGRFYSMDISFPDRMIGVEINGNQHYQKDGSLAPYYQQRHDAIVAEGWTLYEWHYPICFKDAELTRAFRDILSVTPGKAFDYGAYQVPKRKEKKPKKGYPSRRHKNRPSPEVLRSLIWSRPVSTVARELGCAWYAIKRWCDKDGITMPPSTYWPRRVAGQSHEEALIEPPASKPAKRITPAILERVILLREKGGKWAAIGRDVGFDRHTVKDAYLKWCDQRESNPHEGLYPSAFAGQCLNPVQPQSR